MNLQELFRVFVLALATSAISVTISKAKVFEALRYWIAKRNKWFGELVSCSYCTSHWVAIAFVAIYRPRPIHQFFLIDIIVSVFVIVIFSAIVSGLVMRLLQFHTENDDKPARPMNNNLTVQRRG